MTYRPDIPNQANLVRTASGDLALMQGNFNALAPVVSGTVTSGTLPSAAIRGFYFGDTTNRKRFFLQSDGSDVFQVMRNVSGEGSPVWQTVLSFDQVSGEDATFAVKVSGVTPTDAAHLATKNYVDTVPTLSGLADTAISGPTSGQIQIWDGSDWTNVNHAHALNDLTDVSIPSPASGEVLIHNGSQWEADALVLTTTLSSLTDTNISSPISGQFLMYDGSDWVNQNLDTSAGGRHILVGLSGDQSTDLTSGDRIALDGTPFLVSGITNTASGTLVLPSGGSFDLLGQYNANFSAANGNTVVRWYDLTNGLYIGSQGIALPATGTAHTARIGQTLALVVASGGTVEVELRFDGTPTSLTSIEEDGTGAKVIEFGGGASGSGGSSTLSGLTDTSVSGATSGQVLTSDGAGTWTAEDAGGGGGFVSGIIGRKLDSTYSPVGLWLFDGDLTDDAGSGYDFTAVTGAATYTSVNGLSGLRTISYADQTFYHNASGTELTISGDLTVEALVSWDDFMGTRYLVYHETPASEDEEDNVLYGLRTVSGNGLVYFAEYGAGTGINHTIDDNPPQSCLVHLAMVRESDDVTFYLNGRQIGATSTGLNAPTGGQNGKLYLFSGAFGGALCCLKIVASGLSSAEVWAEYERTWAQTVSV